MGFCFVSVFPLLTFPSDPDFENLGDFPVWPVRRREKSVSLFCPAAHVQVEDCRPIRGDARVPPRPPLELGRGLERWPCFNTRMELLLTSAFSNHPFLGFTKATFAAVRREQCDIPRLVPTNFRLISCHPSWSSLRWHRDGGGGGLATRLWMPAVS